MRALAAGLLAALLLAGCAREIPSTYIPPEPTAAPAAADVDLTALSSTMVFAEVYNMLAYPEEYMGKTVRAAGQFAVYEEEDGRRYYAVVVEDALACCTQGLEFVPAGDPAWPEEFPQPGDPITVEGSFALYKVGDFEFCHLVDASLTLGAPEA